MRIRKRYFCYQSSSHASDLNSSAMMVLDPCYSYKDRLKSVDKVESINEGHRKPQEINVKGADLSSRESHDGVSGEQGGSYSHDDHYEHHFTHGGEREEHEDEGCKKYDKIESIQIRRLYARLDNI